MSYFLLSLPVNTFHFVILQNGLNLKFAGKKSKTGSKKEICMQKTLPQ
jgi:hypothetical protein